MSYQRSGTFTQDQLQKFGLAGKDSPPVPTVPPPPFPAVSLCPVHVDDTNKDAFELLWRDRFYQDLRDSPFYIRLKEEVKPTLPLRYSQMLELAKVKIVPKPQFKWNRFPPELQPSASRKRKSERAANKHNPKKMNKDISGKLDLLEKKETTDDDEVPAKPSNPAISDSEDENQEAEALIEDDEHDEEENDYGNSYFDNGEEFNDEDDNIDDGPVY